MDIKAMVQAFGKGVYHSFKGTFDIFYVDKELQQRELTRISPTHSNSPVRRRSGSREVTPVRVPQQRREQKPTVISIVGQCIVLNGVIFLLSLLAFYLFLFFVVKNFIYLPFETNSLKAETIWLWTEFVLTLVFQTIWVVPFLAISKCINNYWFQDIGQSVFRHKRGRPASTLSLSRFIADYIFSVVIETLFLFQSSLMNYLPLSNYVSYPLYIIHISLLYSLYAFEYKWTEMGWEVHKRLACVEAHWPYFLGYGLPLALLTQVSNYSSINGSIFAVLFPFFIVSANAATPSLVECPPLRVFSIVISLSNGLFTSFLGKTDKKPIPSRASSQMRR